MHEETWEDPALSRGQFVYWMCSAVGRRHLEHMPGRHNRMREDFKLGAKMEFTQQKMSESLDALTNSIYYAVRENIQLMYLLLTAWWAVQYDPAPVSYVRVAVELKHTLANLINAIEGVVSWMTGGCISIPIFRNKPCATYEQWLQEIFSDSARIPTAPPPPWLPSVVDKIRTLLNHINEKVPYIYLAMQHVREEHGNDVAYLMSPLQLAHYEDNLEDWKGSDDELRSLDPLMRSLGFIGYRKPVLWELQHMMHYLSETIELMTSGDTGTLRREREDS